MARRGGAPARRVPVPAQIGRVDGHDDLMAFAGADLVIASGTPVRLRRLVRMDVPDFDVVVRGGHGFVAVMGQRSDGSGRPQHEEGDDHEAHDDDPGIATMCDMGAKRVVTHVVTVPVAARAARLRSVPLGPVVQERSWNDGFPARARRTASRSGSRTRRSHALCHSQAAPQVEHESRADPPEYVSASIGDAS
jgi:hypothetical protein